MSPASDYIATFPGIWYLVAPAAAEPHSVEPTDWLAPPWGLVQTWSESTPEDIQDGQLQALWNAIIAWGERCAVDEIVVDGGPNRALMTSLGFRSQHYFSWRTLPFPLRSEWTLRDSPAAIASALGRLTGNSDIQLIARAHGVDRLRVRGGSWDGAYVNLEGLEVENSLSELRLLLRTARIVP